MRGQSTTFRRYWRKLEHHAAFSHQEAVSIGHYSIGRGRKHNMSNDEVHRLVNAIRHLRPIMDQESSQRGRRWLYNLAFTKTHRRRKRNPFNDTQLDILCGPTMFRLVAFSEGKPVYQVLSPMGSATFCYSVGVSAAERISGANRNHAPITLHAPPREPEADDE